MPAPDPAPAMSLYGSGSSSVRPSGQPAAPVLPSAKDAADYVIRAERVAQVLLYRGALLMSDDTPYTRKKLGADKIIWSRTFRGMEDQVFGTTALKLGVGGSLIDGKLLKQLNDAIALHERTNRGVYGEVQKFQLGNGAVAYAFVVLAKDSRGVSGFVSSPDGSFDLVATIFFSTRYPLKKTHYNTKYLSLVMPLTEEELKNEGLVVNAQNSNNVKMIQLMQKLLAGVYRSAAKDALTFAAKKQHPGGGDLSGTELAAPSASGGANPAGNGTGSADGTAAPGTVYEAPATQYVAPVTGGNGNVTTNGSEQAPPPVRTTAAAPAPSASTAPRPAPSAPPAPVTRQKPATPSPGLPRSETPNRVHEDL